MREYQSLTHTTWNCRYHVVFIPKKRKKVIFGGIRKHLGEVFHELARQKECQIVVGHLMRDHCSHVHQHSAKALRIACGWLNQREESHFDSQELHGKISQFHR